MNTIILTSSLDTYDKLDDDSRLIKPLSNINGIVDVIKKEVKSYNNFLYIASVEDNYEITDFYANIIIESFKKVVPFANYQVLDGRNMNTASDLVQAADFILLAGGHVPTQNDFFKHIDLKTKLKDTNAVICGISAGSMNSAERVYAIPEEEGEAIDPNYNRFIEGLGLTDINVFPHFNDIRYAMLDGQRVVEDIVSPDSYNANIVCLMDGSYILQKGDVKEIFGEAYTFVNGNIVQICENGSSIIYENEREL
ncbi:MAG: Type 1 glutamine amidotransferase-like domain-containing protein [Clostridia bacterium]|nr:Type 1 glutamine amidotransferase-like domain-containing protein [Clostridia bacterium]